MKNKFTVADLFLAQLAHWGIKRIYGVAGDAILPLLDAFSRQDKISFYPAAHEQGAAFMANGDARTGTSPGVCIATEGPGLLNLLNGLADAFRDGVPVLAITGQVETGKIDTNSKQYFNQQSLMTPISGFTALLTRPESTLAVLRSAYDKAVGDRTVAHISVPRDIWACAVNPELLPLPEPPSPPGVTGNVGNAITLMRESLHPVLLAGTISREYVQETREIARRWGAALIPAQGSKGAIPWDFPEVPGYLGQGHIPPLLKDADCILLMGSAPYEERFLPGAIPAVQVNTTPQTISGRLTPLAVTGDIKKIIGLILDGLSQHQPDQQWLEKINLERQWFYELLSGETRLNVKPILPRRAVAALNRTIPKEAIIAVDTGGFMHWFDRGFLGRGQKLVFSDYWRCMGFGLPAGIGAALANPDKSVVVLAGDGGFLMTMHELATSVRHQLPVTAIVFNDRLYALEKQNMFKQGLAPVGVQVFSLDFAAVARACGARGFRVEDPELLEETILSAVAHSGPAVVDIIMGEETLPYL